MVKCPAPTRLWSGLWSHCKITRHICGCSLVRFCHLVFCGFNCAVVSFIVERICWKMQTYQANPVRNSRKTRQQMCSLFLYSDTLIKKLKLWFYVSSQWSTISRTAKAAKASRKSPCWQITAPTFGTSWRPCSSRTALFWWSGSPSWLTIKSSTRCLFSLPWRTSWWSYWTSIGYLLYARTTGPSVARRGPVLYHESCLEMERCLIQHLQKQIGSSRSRER